MPSVDDDEIMRGVNAVEAIMNNKSGKSVTKIREEMQDTMQADFSVFRDGKPMEEGLEKIEHLRECGDNLEIKDHSKVFNTALN